MVQVVAAAGAQGGPRAPAAPHNINRNIARHLRSRHACLCGSDVINAPRTRGAMNEP